MPFRLHCSLFSAYNNNFRLYRSLNILQGLYNRPYAPMWMSTRSSPHWMLTAIFNICCPDHTLSRTHLIL